MTEQRRRRSATCLRFVLARKCGNANGQGGSAAIRASVIGCECLADAVLYLGSRYYSVGKRVDLKARNQWPCEYRRTVSRASLVSSGPANRGDRSESGWIRRRNRVSLEAESEEGKQDDPLHVKHRPCKRRCRDAGRNTRDWRMSPGPSGKGLVNTTRPERGPPGTGGNVGADVSHSAAELRFGAWPSRGADPRWTSARDGGLAPTLEPQQKALRKRARYLVPGAELRKPNVQILWRATGSVSHSGTCFRLATECLRLEKGTRHHGGAIRHGIALAHSTGHFPAAAIGRWRREMTAGKRGRVKLRRSAAGGMRQPRLLQSARLRGDWPTLNILTLWYTAESTSVRNGVLA